MARKRPPPSSIGPDGHLYVELDGKQYLAEQLIWKMQTGEDPQARIIHINGDPTDNRWANLRLATPLDDLAARWRV